MSGPDRPEPHDPEALNWPDDDPEATRLVRHEAAAPTSTPADTPSDPSDGPSTGSAPGAPSNSFGTDEPWRTSPPSGTDEPWRTGPSADDPRDQPGPMPDGGDGPSTGPGSPMAQQHPPASGPGPSYGAGAPDPDATSAMRPYQPADQSSSPTSYFGAPTTAYPGPGTTGPQAYSQPAGYSYQRPPDAAVPSGPGPQAIPPPSTANVVLPPVRMPKAESRMALNLLGAIVGLLLVAGGLALVLLNQGKMRRLSTSDLTPTGGAPTIGGTIDTLALVLTIVGIVLIAVAALLSAWASWAPILPGVLLSAASVWAMVTTGENSGAVMIAKGTKWAFKDGQFALFCMSGLGLLVGLSLLATGLAAVFLRAGVRRTIRQQLESIQA